MDILAFDHEQEYEIPNDGKRRFGIELELCRKDIFKKINEDYDGYFESDEYYEDRDESAAEISGPFEDWCILKHDGTVAAGFEIVTDPLLFEEQRAKWTPEIFKFLIDKKFISWEAKTAAHHIHCSRAGLSDLQIGKVLKFIHNPDNYSFIKKIAQREECQYAPFSIERDFSYIFDWDKDKYTAFNIMYEDTVEFRMFRGTLNYEAFHKNLDFCDAILEFGAPCITSVSESLVWWNFADYVRQYQDKYQFLWNFLISKQIDSIDSWMDYKAERKAKRNKKEKELS